MAVFKILAVTLLATVAKCEPPVHHSQGFSSGNSGYNYDAPSTNYISPSAAPSSTYGAPSSNYGAPSTNYAAPSSNYAAPSSSFAAPSSSYGAPSTSYAAPSSSYGAPSSNIGGSSYDSHGNGHDDGHNDHREPKSYEFGYTVKDAHSGNDYGRQETSDGNTVRGEYRVALPDGRTQIVTYHADWQTGFHADVRYEGEAQYPETNSGYGKGPNTAYGAPNTAYGAPSSGIDSYNSNNNYNSESIYNQNQGFSGSLTGFGSQHGSSGSGYDSYSQTGNNFNKPSAAYGTPAFH